MNNFGKYITPEEAAEIAISNGDMDKRSTLIKHYTKMAKSNAKCENCDEKAWKYAGFGLCFSCATGEADASEDMELRE